MPTYIITWHGTTGEVWRNGTGGYQAVMFLHCSEAEAREIADDLGATWVTPRKSENGYSPDLAVYRQNPDNCPADCEHARHYGLPESVIESLRNTLEDWKRN